MARKSQVKEKLSNLKKGTLSVTDFLNTLVGYADDLAEINSPLEEDDLVILALNGLALDKDYDTIVVTLKNQIHALTMMDVRSKLLVHEEWVSNSNAMRKAHLESGFPSAFAAQQRGSSFHRGGSSKRGFHPSSQQQTSFSRSNSQRTFSPSNTYPNPTTNIPPQNKCQPTSNPVQGRTSFHTNNNGPSECQICERIGHVAYNCRFRYYPKSNSNSAGSTSSSSNPPLHQAFNSLHLSPQDQIASHEQWIADSGANAHMTSNLTNLQDIQSFDGSDQVMLGDGNINRSGSS